MASLEGVITQELVTGLVATLAVVEKEVVAQMKCM